MKIGLVCPYRLSIPGGVREHVLALYSEFIKRGHEVKVIAPGDGKSKSDDDFLLLGRSVRVPTPNKSWAVLSLYFLGEMEESLKEILAKEKFDVLHFHEPFAPFLSWQILQISKAKNIATFHSFLEGGYSINTLRYLLQPFEGYFQTHLDGRIAVSKVAKNCWASFFENKGVVIPNGVDLERFNPKVAKIKRYQDGKINILFVGRFDKRKGLFYLLEAAKILRQRVKNIRIILVGSGPQSLQVKLWVKAQNLEDLIEFAGKISDQKLPSYYTSADIFCSPAVGGESFGIVLLEAVASALPIVAFANPGYKELLKDYPCRQCLVEPEDTDGLALSLEVLIKNKALRKKLSAWGLDEVQKYNWQKIADRVLNYYQKVLKA